MYRRLADALLVGVCVSQEGRICYVNHEFARLVGYDVNALKGCVVDELFAFSGDTELSVSNQDEKTQGPQRFTYQTKLLTRYGEPIEAEVNGTQTKVKGKQLRFMVLQRT